MLNKMARERYNKSIPTTRLNLPQLSANICMNWQRVCIFGNRQISQSMQGIYGAFTNSTKRPMAVWLCMLQRHLQDMHNPRITTPLGRALPELWGSNETDTTAP